MCTLKDLSPNELEFLLKVKSGEAEVKHCQIKGFSRELKTLLRDHFDKFEELTVSEYCIWSGRCKHTVYRDINRGVVVGKRLGGEKSDFTINLDKTKENIAKFK